MHEWTTFDVEAAHRANRQATALERIAAALEEQNRAVWNLVRVGACGIVEAGDRHAVLRTANDATYHANQALRDQDGDDDGGDADG